MAQFEIENVMYLPSGRIFLLRSGDQIIEATEMRDVSVDGKLHEEVRNSLDPHVIWRHLVDFEQKWLMTVSTQYGCPHKCQFCDVGNMAFCGNLSFKEISDQICMILDNTPYVKKCDKAKIGFARMGEPAHNLENVLNVIRYLPVISAGYDREFNWLPCFNTILPRKCKFSPEEVLVRVTEVKENDYEGFLHFQLSCNSTDEEKRRELFGGSGIMSIEEIVAFFSDVELTNRTITLNFIVMKDVEVSVDKLKKMGLNADKFRVKLIPLNNTIAKQTNNLETFANYSNYEDLLALKDEFEKAGIPVVVDAIAKCEEAGLCCGQLAQVFMKQE